MKRVVLWLFVLSMAALTGCAVQGPVRLDQSYWAHKPESVGIVIAKMPNPGSHKLGAQGLLDVAINNAMADGLEKHLNSLDQATFNQAGDLIAKHFQQQGIATKLIPDTLDPATLQKVKSPPKDSASLDYSALKAKYGVDQLIVLEVLASGTIRSYYGFVPLGAPQGYFSCRGSLVDLSNNKLLWFATATRQTVVDDPWDQAADAYPHITSAFQKAMQDAQGDLVQQLIGSTQQLSSTH